MLRPHSGEFAFFIIMPKVHLFIIMFRNLEKSFFHLTGELFFVKCNEINVNSVKRFTVAHHLELINTSELLIEKNTSQQLSAGIPSKCFKIQLTNYGSVISIRYFMYSFVPCKLFS
jgi:hypothetical protein